MRHAGSEKRRKPRNEIRCKAFSCPSWARTRTLLIQSQACCQLHQGAPKTVVRLPFSVIRNPLWAPSARRPETFGQRKTDNGKRLCFHGAEGARTPDLLGAIQALSQLSYSPSRNPKLNPPTVPRQPHPYSHGVDHAPRT